MTSTPEKAQGSRAVAFILAACILGVLAMAAIPLTVVVLFGAKVVAQGKCEAPTVGGGTSVINDGNQAPYTGEWINPMPGRLTSPFGMRTHPVTGKRLSHSGQDIAAADNTPIHAAGSGTVTIAGKSSGGNTGYMVAIDHGGGIQSRYVHMWPEDIKVKVGQKVNVGEVVGLEGTSGQSTGPHLHFEIRINGKPTEPMAWMKNKGVTLGTGPNTTDVKPPQDSTQPTEEEAAPAYIPTRGPNATQREFKSTEGETFKPSQKQWENLQRVLKSADETGMGKRAATIAIMTVLVESKARMYANTGVPESLNYPHDAVGSDHDSVGLFQQRPSMGWGTVKELMEIDYSTKKFLSTLKALKGWENMPLGNAAQRVQRSAFPDRYATWESAATAIVNGSGANFAKYSAEVSNNPCQGIAVLNTKTTAPTTEAPETPTTGPTGTNPTADTPAPTPGEPADPTKNRQDINRIATNQIKAVPYLPGGRDRNGWDSNGFVWWTTNEAGLKGIPYIDAHTAATPTTTPTPGDLVTCGQRPDGTYRTSGIYTDNHLFITVLEGQGTIRTPIPSTCSYHSLVKQP